MTRTVIGLFLLAGDTAAMVRIEPVASSYVLIFGLQTLVMTRITTELFLPTGDTAATVCYEPPLYPNTELILRLLDSGNDTDHDRTVLARRRHGSNGVL